ncbi:MAG: hypothetical protein GKR93_16435 [Gammaproteobacteria bacterium]|nr:hypothetical protein [Gammaproteobacteria bacterium]
MQKITLFLPVSLLISLSGLGCLFYSWKRQPDSAIYRTAGWILLTGSIYPWGRALGFEYGTILFFAVPALASWFVISTNMSGFARAEQGVLPETKGFDLKLGRVDMYLFLLIVPVCGLSSLLSSLAIAVLLPVSLTNQMATAVILLPLIWGALGSWVVMSTRPVAVAALLLCAAGISAASIFIR